MTMNTGHQAPGSRGLTFDVTPTIDGTSTVYDKDVDEAFEADTEDGSDDEISDSGDEENAEDGEGEQNEANGNGVEMANTNKGNKLLGALMDAVHAYSSKLRLPVPCFALPRAPQTPSSSFPEPETLEEILSDESDNEEEGEPPTDRPDNAEPALTRQKFDDGEGPAKMFYTPKGPWAELSRSPIENTVVLAKLHSGAMCDACIKQGLLGGRMITYISKIWPSSQRWEGFFSELALYSDTNFLYSLQGSVVPKIIGCYSVEGGVGVAMELPSSDFWVEASDDMSNHLKRNCISAFDKIHERGILHDDVELRHILVNSHGDVTIIDFQRSRALVPIVEAGMGAATEAEIRLERRKVRFKLNYEDSRQKEFSKMKRAKVRETRKELCRVKRQSCSGPSEKVTPVHGEESEPEDPEDVLHPTVDPETFEKYWIGEPFTPICYIAPGQDRVNVGSKVQEFLMEELDRQEKDEKCDPDKKVPSTEIPQSSSTPLRTTPILPERVKLKRGRDDDGDDPFASPSPKKQHLSRGSTEAKGAATNGTVKGVASPDVASENITSNSSEASGRSDFADLVPEIFVPFEGYTDSDGYVLPNTFSPKELGSLRKIWIQTYSVKRSREEGLPYPIAEMSNLTPSTLPKIVEYDRDGNKRKKKRRPRRNVGTLKRTRMTKGGLFKCIKEATARREDYFRNRCEPGTGLSDVEDDEEDNHRDPTNEDEGREGPRIVTGRELQESGPRDERYCPAFDPRPASPPPRLAIPKHTKKPSKGILRRHLTSAEKARNVSLLEEHKRKYESDSDADADTDTSESVWRPLKRARIDPIPPGTRNSLASGNSDGSQNLSNSSNVSGTRPRIIRRVSSTGVPLPYLSRLSKSPVMASPSKGPTSPYPSPRSNSSAVKATSGVSAPDGRFSEPSNDTSGSSSPRGDQGPSSPAVRRSKGSSRWSTQTDPGSWAPGLHDSSLRKPSSTAEEREKQPWGFSLGFTWRWPKFKK